MSKEKVLIIDDNPMIVDVLQHMLTQHGRFEPVVAYDGVQGLERFVEDRPVAVIVDAKMPGIDGFQFLRILRGDLESAQAALVMLTALIRDQDRLASLISGADVYLTKPFKSNDVIEAIEQAMQITPEERMARMEAMIREWSDA